MKFRFLFVWAVLLVSAAVASAQKDNTYYALDFKGGTVGLRVTAAQNACSADVRVPCVIILGPTLAAYPVGVMPVKCAQCVWLDYRTVAGAPGGSGAPIVTPDPPPSSCSVAGSIYIQTTADGDVIYICDGSVFVPLGYPGVTSDHALGLAIRGAVNVHGGAIVQPPLPSKVGLTVQGTSTGGFKTPTFVQGRGDYGGGNSWGMGFVDPVAKGDLLVAVLSGHYNGSQCVGVSITDTFGDSFTRKAFIRNPIATEIWAAIATQTGSDGVSFLGEAGTACHMQIIEYSGVTQLVDGVASAGGQLTGPGPWVAPSITTTAADLVISAFSADNTSGGFVYGAAGFTSRSNVNWHTWDLMDGYGDMNAGPGVVVPTAWTFMPTNPNYGWSALTVAFRAAPVTLQSANLVEYNDPMGNLLGGVHADGTVFPVPAASTVGTTVHLIGTALCALANSTDSGCAGTITLPSPAPFADSAYAVSVQPFAASGAYLDLTITGKAAGSFTYELSCSYNCSAVGPVLGDVTAYHN